ncbi:MAG: hypothetical protein LUB56_03440 [Coprobacillus sp.]|nr:hypothetical protein [Coprobacillus sp.]
MSNTVIILIAVIVAAAVIAIVAYIIYRAVNPRLKDDKPTEEEVAEEELNRMLSPVEDEKAIEEMREYDRKLQEEENGESESKKE